MSPKPTIIGLFAGVGGIELGFKQAGFQAIGANEIDSYAVKTYRDNHEHHVLHEDIKNATGESLLALSGSEGVTVLAGGFPCQPFSVAGLRKGFDDSRGNVFWDIHRLIGELSPEVIFLENVKNLENHDEGRTFKTIVEALEGEIKSPEGLTLNPGYTVKHAVLNAKDFGIPQNRERIFVVAFKDSNMAAKFKFPKGSSDPLDIRPLSDFIDFEVQLEPKYYYDNKRPFFEKLEKGITTSETVYQWRRQYVRENKSGLCPTLTANMGMGGHNVPLVLTKFGIRKLTPMECFKLMGFENMSLPADISDSRLYKQAGNAVVVPVITAIAKAVKKALG
jgi:DNA (cytosine-5)-methyltransferase 1